MPPAGPRVARIAVETINRGKQQDQEQRQKTMRVDRHVTMIVRRRPLPGRSTSPVHNSDFEYEVAFAPLPLPDPTEVVEHNSKASISATTTTTSTPENNDEEPLHSGEDRKGSFSETTESASPSAAVTPSQVGKVSPAYLHRYLDEEWRCSTCVLNSQFFLNGAQSRVCEECKKDVNECGRCYWLLYEELPFLAKREVDIRYLPKIVSIIQTRWPDVQVHCLDGKPPSI